MRRRTGWTAIGGAVLAATAAVAVPTSAQAHGHAWGCQREFDRALARYQSTTADRDAQGFIALMAPDYTGVLPDGSVLAGKDAGAAFIQRFFARTDWTQTFTVTREKVQGCKSAVVVFDSVYSDEDGPEPLVIALSWVREHGRWRVLLDQNTPHGS